MNYPTTIASQAAVVARELSSLIELLSTDNAYPIADAIELVESAGRLTDCARVRVLGRLAAEPVLAERLGYASPTAAVASIARISERAARSRLKVATAVTPGSSLTGAGLSAPHPLVGEALDAGEMGLDAATLIATELGTLTAHAPLAVIEVAEQVMVGLATGVSPTGEPMVAAVSVDYLAAEIRQVTATADPDGARPREERAMRRRDFRLGKPDEDGLVPAGGRLLPEVASLFAGLVEAHRRSPKFVDTTLVSADDLAFGADSRSRDPRTPGQRRHDALAEILMAAAASDGAPSLDGLPVSVLVTVSAADLANQNGRDSDPIGTMAGSPFPISRRTIERFIDAGGYRVIKTDENGAVTFISSPQRCFTPIQRLGMAGRDGFGCITPGCTSPHFMLQAHHVIPDRDDGPTSLDNGVLICYWHHLIVDTGPWHYRMINGIPYVQGPGIPDWTRARGTVARAA